MVRVAAGLLILAAASAPANQWVEQPPRGWKGKTEYGNVLRYGFCEAGELGLAVWDAQETVGTVRLRAFDPADGAWTEPVSAPLEPAYAEFSSGRRTDGYFHGLQLCYDSDRKTLVGLTSTDLNGNSRTVEFDVPPKKAAGVKPDPSPPTVTAASLCYDPVNKEVVLATGGFSPVGGTDGTWLYDGARKSWRRLAGPREVEDVRHPLDKVRDRIVALRWLTWKNLEFRATGRDALLDDRARADALAREGGLLVSEVGKLAPAAKANAGKAERPYHRERLAAAAELLDRTAALLAGADGTLKAGTPEETEALYRGRLVPAQETVEKAIAELETSPEPRMSARLVYDSKNRVIVCFGGDGQRRSWGDTWVYHCAGRWWERRRPKLHPAPGPSRRMAFDSRSGQVVLAAKQLWTYDAAKDEWRPRNIATPAEAFWLEHVGKSGCLVAFNHGLNKAWRLQLDVESAPPADAKQAPDVAWVPVDGQYVLRDAATVADLKTWKSEMDAWVQAVPANTWVPAPARGTGRPNSGRTWSSHVYDPDRRQLYYRDGGHGSYHGADTDHYDLPTGRWFRSDRRDLPPWPMGTYFGWGRSFSYAPWAIHSYKYNLWYNPLRQRLQRTASAGTFELGTPAAGVLEYDPDTGLWSRDFYPLPGKMLGMISGSVVPGLPDGLAGIQNFTRYGTANGEAWVQTAQGLRHWKDLGMLPRTWDDHSFCWFFDPKRKRIHYYGGPKEKHQLFALDVTDPAPKWKQIPVKGSSDGSLPLSSREVVYVPRHDVFLMMSTLDAHKRAPLEDLIWSYAPAGGVFRRLKLAKDPGVTLKEGGSVSEGLQYDPAGDLCFFTQASGSVPQLVAFRYVPAEDGK